MGSRHEDGACVQGSVTWRFAPAGSLQTATEGARRAPRPGPRPRCPEAARVRAFSRADAVRADAGNGNAGMHIGLCAPDDDAVFLPEVGRTPAEDAGVVVCAVLTWFGASPG